MKTHNYSVQVGWTGNTGEGTKTYKGYGRDHTIKSGEKPPIPGSSDPAFRGDPARYNPEELLVASLSACHMLWYLHLCATKGIVVLDYQDAASGVMQENEDGSGQFLRVNLRPLVRIAEGGDGKVAIALHHEAHALCFIARSVNFPVEVSAEVLEENSIQAAADSREARHS